MLIDVARQDVERARHFAPDALSTDPVCICDLLERPVLDPGEKKDVAPPGRQPIDRFQKPFPLFGAAGHG